MNWMINIFFLIFLTSLTGMFMQLVWLAAAKLCGHKNPLVIYIGLWFVCLSYFIPIIYILVWGSFKSSFYRVHDNNYNHIMERIFPLVPPSVKTILYIISVLWVSALFFFSLYHIFRFLGRMRFKKTCSLETNMEVLKKLEECQKRLSVRKAPKVYCSSELSGPLCTGVFSKAIMMPKREYSSEELDVIFMHELTHIKHHDLELKFLSHIIAVIHCFNIPTHFLFRQISIWSEIRCDILTCQESRELFNTKKYYSIILKIIGDDGDKNIKKLFTTSLAEKRSEITERMIYVSQYKRAGKGIQRAVASIVIAAFMAGSTVSFAAGTMSLNYYDKVVKNKFSVDEKEEIQESGIEEITKNVDKKWNLVNITDSFVSTEGIGMEYYGTINSVDTCLSEKIYCEKGSKIKICGSFREDVNKDIVAGIIDSNYTSRSIKSKKFVLYEFEIEESGYYNVFIQNINTFAIDVKFVYCIL